jgi:hypothetical protein
LIFKYYIIETKKGYVKRPTFIFDELTRWYKDAFKFKKKEDVKKFLLLRNKNNYKVYKIGY